ncbi:MAG: hypothetical protein EOR84_12355 [Mesorhizobium sp.]|nr:MAG: hypothetical protein EOR84_12355 [Mesorhizobium sp.]
MALTADVALYGALLWPALFGKTWHLPHLGGDWQLRHRAHSCNVRDWRKQSRQPISPLVGEMPSFAKEGRPEGGAVERNARPWCTPS